MKIKKYIAPTMKEAVEKMRDELGADAIILSTRTIPAPQGSGYPSVELTGAIDVSKSEDTPSIKAIIRPDQQMNSPRALEIQKYAETLVHQLKTKRTNGAKNIETIQTQEISIDLNNFQNSAAFHSLQEELNSLKLTLQSVAQDVRYKQAGMLNDACKFVYKALIDAYIPEELAIRTINSIIADGAGVSVSLALRAARKFLGVQLEVSNPIQRKDKRQIFTFIGSTGSGKTTTLAKLATISRLALQADVLLISADTYRIGGAEQLQTIAAIANIPFQTVYSSQELRQILLKETKRDFIFIDTVGRSPKNEGHLHELKAFIDAATPDATYLLVESTMSDSALQLVLDKFKPLKPTHLILTKVDEVSSLGGIINVLIRNSLPIAFWTTGQTIPDDIEPASRSKLMEILLPSELEPENAEVFA